MQWATGEVYDGAWEQDLMHGKGALKEEGTN